MKLRSISLAAAAVIAAAVAGSANAGIVYQSTPALGPGVVYACSDCSNDGTGFHAQSLDPFTLGASANITGVDVVTLNANGDSGLTGFTVDVYTSSSNASSLIFSQTVTPTLVNSGPDPVYGSYDVLHAALSGLSLTGGEQYWISFYASNLAIGATPGNNNGAIQWSPPGSGTIVTNFPYDLEYALYAGGVPEPSVWAMLILGVAMIGFAARRRRQGAALAA